MVSGTEAVALPHAFVDGMVAAGGFATVITLLLVPFVRGGHRMWKRGRRVWVSYVGMPASDGIPEVRSVPERVTGLEAAGAAAADAHEQWREEIRAELERTRQELMDAVAEVNRRITPNGGTTRDLGDVALRVDSRTETLQAAYEEIRAGLDAHRAEVTARMEDAVQAFTDQLAILRRALAPQAAARPAVQLPPASDTPPPDQ